ncbi:MAG: hypothetical protein K5756_00105 [Clostridiales bacterium]|nr:hypothetical protein [Clostridiales bacterium]
MADGINKGNGMTSVTTDEDASAVSEAPSFFRLARPAGEIPAGRCA